MKYLTIIFLIIFNFIVNAQWTNSTTDNTSIIIVPETVSLMDGVCNSVSDGSGGVIIVWSATRPGPSGKDIYAQRLDTSGTRLWGDGGVVICNATADQINPVLISDGAGGAIIAWEDARDYALTGLNIYAQRVDGNGSIQWFTNGTVVCANGLDQMNPVICSDSSSFQGAYIAWVDWRNGLDPNIYAQRILGNGNVQWLSNGNPICEAPRPQNSVSIITADAQGNAIISWIDYRNATPYSPQIYSQKVNRNGFGQWANNGNQISANTDVYLGFSSVIPDYAGGAIFSWDSYGSSGTTGLDIYAQRVSGIGNVLWNPLGIKVCESSGNQYFPNLVGDGKGGAIITWSDERSSPGTSIYAQRINAALGAKLWAADGKLICSDTYSDYGDIRIVPTSSGGAIICWSDQRNINISQLDIYAQRIDPNGNSLWTPSGTVISNNIAQQVYPEIINDGSDNAIIIWPDGRQSVYAQRILKEGSFVYRHVIDGFILNDEYGSHIEGENQKTSDSKTWYMDWTEDSLFIGVAAFDDPNDALIFYLDTKVQIPVNLDNNSNGNLLGDDHLGAIQPQLPFTSDFYLYYSPTYGRYF